MNRTPTSRRLGCRTVVRALGLAATAQLLGCGDPEASPPSAALEVNISGAGCQVAGGDSSTLPPQTVLVGRQALGDIELTSRDSVTCRVTDTGGGAFTFMGTFSARDEDGAQVNFSMLTGAATTTMGNDGTGTASLSVTRSANPLYQLGSPTATPCTLTIRAITRGGIWAEYNCSTLTDPQTPGASCTGVGAFVFNNCSG